MTEQPLLHVEDLRVHIATSHGAVRAVERVGLTIGASESMGIVGESGSGKSVMARAIMGILPPNSEVAGSILFRGQDLVGMRRRELEALWGRQISMVFQDPGRSLNPVVRIERQLTEGMRRHLGFSRSRARERAVELLSEVGVSDPERRLRVYPHQLSGGMRQRVMIAIALACEPDLLIADEPTTALDVTIQRQILDLLRRIQRERQMSLMLISHDLAVVAGRTDRVGVMYAGRLAEAGSTRTVFAAPQHRYTEALLEAVPRTEDAPHTRLRVIPGGLPDPTNPPHGCRFAARCRYADEICREPVELVSVGRDHEVACVHPAPTPTYAEAEVRSA
ncbi:ABC transporter ATP-binding protein [Microbacterium sp. A588]